MLFQSVDLDKYLHPGERALINKILDIVKECNIIRNFIHAISNEDAKGSRRNLMKRFVYNWHNCFTFNVQLFYSTEYVVPGLYIRALCDGMDQALEPFREEIIELENTVLNDHHTPLSLILCSIEKYTCLFSVLNSIIREVIILSPRNIFVIVIFDFFFLFGLFPLLICYNISYFTCAV